MKKIPTIALSIAALFCAATVANAADIYLDLNGTSPGFGVDSTASPIDLNFSNTLWNTDSTGGAGGSLVVAGTNDVLNFGLEGAGGILFNWSNYGDLVAGGINVYRPDTNDTASVNRFQKKGGGFLTFEWGTNATWATDIGTPLHWDLGTVGDFEKLGSKWLTFADGGVKVNGTCTITEGFIVIRQTGTVNANSSFKLNGGELRFKDTIDDGGATTATIGVLSGSGGITRDGSGSALGDLTVLTMGIDMGNDSATDTISFGWGSTVALASGSSNVFDIAKTAGPSYLADTVKVDWEKPFTLGGHLTVNLVSGSDALAEGDTFQILEKNAAASFVGNFASFDLPPLSGGLIWSTTSLTSDGTISVVSPSAGPPADPTGLVVVTSGVYSVSLDWDDNTDLDLAGYKIYRSETSGAGFSNIATVAASEFVDASADPNDTTYYYTVSAYDVDANESGQTGEVDAHLAFALSNGDFETPALASGGTAIGTSGHWMEVDYTTNGLKQAIQFAAWASEDSAQGAWLKGWNQTVTNAFYQDKNAVPGKEYTLDAGFDLQSNFRANGGQVEMSLVWLDGGGTEISRNTLDVDNAIPAPGWNHTSISATAPMDAAMVRSLFYWTTTTNAGTGSGSQSALIDNASLVVVGEGDLYAAWANSFGLSGSPDADPGTDYDGDLLTNLEEYGLGGDPTNSADKGHVPTFATLEDGGTNAFDYVYARRTGDSSLSYHLETTPDLIYTGWADSGYAVVGIGPNVDGFDTVTNRTSTTEAAKFIKLVIEQN